MDSLISRQAAIDAFEMLLEQSEDDEHDKTWNKAIRGAINAVKHHVPSAQPDFSCEGCQTPKHICGICMRNYPNITDHYTGGEAG